MERIKLFRDSFQNWKNKEIPKAQLILTDIPYQLGTNAYGSNPMWYEGGTTLMEKVNMQRKNSLIQIQKPDSEFQSFFTSVLIF